LDARQTTLFCKKIIVAKSKHVETSRSDSTDLSESSKEGYGSKGAVLPKMMMILNLLDGLCPLACSHLELI
jgi:hypothetical protein